MKIKLFANLRDIAGRDEIEVEVVSPISLVELFNSISTSYGEMARRYLLNPTTGQVADNLLISVNGRTALNTKNINLQNEDNITILPVLAGG